MSDIPAPDSRVLVVSEESRTDDGKLCRQCPHNLTMHSGLHVTCVLCADHHGFVYRIPPPQPVVFMSESEAQERLTALKAQETTGLHQATGPVSADVWRVPPGTEIPRRHYGAMPPGPQGREAQEDTEKAAGVTQALASCYGPDAYARCQCGHTYGWHSGVGGFQCDWCQCTHFRRKEEDSVTPVAPVHPATDLAQHAPCTCGHTWSEHAMDVETMQCMQCHCARFRLAVDESASCRCGHSWGWHIRGGDCVLCGCTWQADGTVGPASYQHMLSMNLIPETVEEAQSQLKGWEHANDDELRLNALEQLGCVVLRALKTKERNGTPCIS